MSVHQVKTVVSCHTPAGGAFAVAWPHSLDSDRVIATQPNDGNGACSEIAPHSGRQGVRGQAEQTFLTYKGGPHFPVRILTE